MRIDLEHSDRRPWLAKLALAVMGRIVGMKPGPMLVMTYEPELLHPKLRSYVLRGVANTGPWSKGESELFAAFVSNLNTCQF